MLKRRNVHEKGMVNRYGDRTIMPYSDPVFRVDPTFLKRILLFGRRVRSQRVRLTQLMESFWKSRVGCLYSAWESKTMPMMQGSISALHNESILAGILEFMVTRPENLHGVLCPSGIAIRVPDGCLL